VHRDRVAGCAFRAAAEIVFSMLDADPSFASSPPGDTWYSLPAASAARAVAAPARTTAAARRIAPA